MSRPLIVLSAAISCIAGSITLAQEVFVPQPLDAALVQTEPYAYNGLIRADGSLGSASMVGEGVYVTAAHILYDDDAFVQIPASSVFYYPQFHEGGFIFPSGNGYQTTAYYWWDSYGSRVENDPSGPGLSSPDTFNIDFAAGYIAGLSTPAELLRYPEVNVDQENEVGILRDRREKTMVGYPQAPPIPSGDRGLMHATVPADYFCYWAGLQGISERDSGNLWIATYDFDGVTTYGGGSGGPIYARDDLGEWVMAAIAVGSNGSDGMFARAVDEGAWQWIEQAVTTRNNNAIRRVDDLQVTKATSERVWLDWTDQSLEEDGYAIFRHFNGTYEEIAILPANRNSFIDTSATPGHVYHYQVQPFSSNGNRPPKSPEVSVSTPNSNPVARDALNLPWLQFTSAGDSTWFVDEQNRLRSGKVRSLGYSSLVFEIIGPGTLSFEWSVSSEENLEYSTPGAEFEGIVYDAIYLYLNGVPYYLDNESVFLSGSEGPLSRQIEIPAGPATIEWRYEKDPYTDEFEDAGFLHSVDWIPDATSPYSVYGGYSVDGTTLHASEWLGRYEASLAPWIRHEELGWMYSIGISGLGIFGYSSLPEIGYFYTAPEYFPFLYLPETENWFYYFEGTGYIGEGAWFLDMATNELVQSRG